MAGKLAITVLAEGYEGYPIVLFCFDFLKKLKTIPIFKALTAQVISNESLTHQEFRGA